MSPEYGFQGDGPSPSDEVKRLCSQAMTSIQVGNESMEAIDQRLDQAFTLATTHKDEAHGPASDYKKIAMFTEVANAAWVTGASEDFVRKALDKAVGVFEAATETTDTPSLNVNELESALMIASGAGLGPDYIKPIFDKHIRPHVLSVPDSLGYESDFSDRLDRVLSRASKYGLSEDYQMEILQGVREEAQELPQVLHVVRLETVARSMYQLRKDPEQAREIIDEAREILNDDEVEPAERITNMNDLAWTAHYTGQSPEYIGQLLRENMGYGYHNLLEQADIDAVHLLRNTMRFCVALDLAPSSEPIATRAITFIGTTMEGTSRERHQLLNGLLRGSQLPEDYTARGQIKKKPLSYVFVG